MKTCLKCDTRARNSETECTNCGAAFSYISDEPDDDYETRLDRVSDLQSAPAVSVKSESSLWTKVIAICLILLVAQLGYQQFHTSKLSDCRSNALQVTMLIKVLDVRVSGFSCEYLVQYDNFGIGPANQPNWVPQYILDTHIKSESDVKNN